MTKHVNLAWLVLALAAASAAAQTTVTTSGGTTYAAPICAGGATLGNSPTSAPGSDVGGVQREILCV